MNREKQLVKNTAIITIGKVSTQIINFLLLPLYTTLLTTKEFGLVDFINALGLLIAPLLTFQIEQGVFRFLVDNRENEEKKSNIISSVFLGFAIQIICFTLISIIGIYFTKSEYGIFLVIYTVSYAFMSILLQMSRGLGDNMTYTKASALVAMATVIGNVLLITVINLGAYGMLISSIVAYLLGSIYIFWKKNIFSYIVRRASNWSTIISLWRYSIPLIPNAISWWVFNTSDRVIVKGYLGMNANGILAVAHKYPQMYVAIYNIFNIAWTESASLHINDSDADKYFSKIINITMRIFTAIFLMIITTMPVVFPLMVNNNYEEAYGLIPILMLASFGNIGVGVISVIYIALKDTKSVAKTSFAAAIINCIIHILLVNRIGLYAAAVSTFVAYYVLLIYRYFDLKKRINIKLDKVFLFSTIFVLSIICIFNYIKIVGLELLGFIIGSIYAIYINRQLLKSAKKFINKKFHV